jgi:hypothetical protein
MDIGRGEILTGLASVAVAGVVPALPDAALPTPTLFLRSFIGGQRAGSPLNIATASHWHYDESPGEIMICHLETGLTFIRTSSDEHDAVLEAPPEDEAFAGFLADHFEASVILHPGTAHPCGLAASLIRHHAAFVALVAYLALMCRPQHQGAVYFRFRPDAADPYDEPIIEDAPPLPRMSA